MNNELNSVEDIDALLDNKYNITDNNDEDNENTDTGAEENVDTDNNKVGEDNNEGSSDENDEKGSDDGTSDQNNENKDNNNDGGTQKKLTVDEKKEFAFGKIRQENATLRQEKQKLEQEAEFIKALAAANGYTDTEQFKADVKNAQIAKEAKDKGVDFNIYKKLQEQDEKIKALDREKQEALLVSRAGNFKNAVETAVVDYGVDKDEIFNRLEKSGYTVDTILSLPDPKIVIDGVLKDKILEVSKQKELKKKETLDNLADDKHDGGSSEKTVTLDELLKSDLEEYKKANYL